MINRYEFLVGGVGASLVGAVRTASAACCTANACSEAVSARPFLYQPKQPAQLNLCLQWGSIPVADDFNAKLDYLEQNG